MGLSEIPPPLSEAPGQDLPDMRVRPPGPASRTWHLRLKERQAPMGPRAAAGVATEGPIVLSRGTGCNVLDVDMNRYVDMAGGFGALLLGHCHPSVARCLEIQSARLLQALGDVFPSDAKVGVLERLAQLLPLDQAQIILGQSGADAVSAALKTALLATGKAGVVAFQGSYHGLSYGPLAVTDLRPSYRAPFREQLSPHVRFCPYPARPDQLEASLNAVRQKLAPKDVGAILVEPILGRGGVVVPPHGFLTELRGLADEYDCLLVFDEIWTAMGRVGDWFASSSERVRADLICVGKGLGGGLPISACAGSRTLMETWSREEEVVHTSTFAGAPLACASALATIDVLSRQGLVRRAETVGEAWKSRLEQRLQGTPISEVRGRGFMLGLDAADLRGGAAALQRELLRRGFLTSTGGGKRDVLVLTPPLTISEPLLDAFDDAVWASVQRLGRQT